MTKRTRFIAFICGSGILIPIIINFSPKQLPVLWNDACGKRLMSITSNHGIGSGEHQLVPSEERIPTFQSVLKHYENFPADLLPFERKKEKRAEGEARRDKEYLEFPPLLNIAMSHGVYQVAHTSFGTVYIRSCHMDYREKKGPVARCIVFLELNQDFYSRNEVRRYGFRGKYLLNVTAQFWSKNKETIGQSPIVSMAWYPRMILSEGAPAIMNFPCYEIYERVVALSIRESSDSRAVTNVIKVRHQLQAEQKKDFVVCLEDVFFPFEDVSKKFVEWIEMLRILGADAILTYPTGEFQHPNVMRVLRYYEKKGVLGLRQSAWAGRHSWPTGIIQAAFPLESNSTEIWLRETFAYMNRHSCLMESVGRYKYMVSLDVDELLLPTTPDAKTWHDLLRKSLTAPEENNHFASVCFNERQMIKTDDVILKKKEVSGKPAFLGMVPHSAGNDGFFLSHVHATRKFNDTERLRRKCIFNLDQVVQTIVHKPVLCVGNNRLAAGECRIRKVGKTDVGRSYHYRSQCLEGVSSRPSHGVDYFSCEPEEIKKRTFYLDDTVWKYRDDLNRAVEIALSELHLVS